MPKTVIYVTVELPLCRQPIFNIENPVFTTSSNITSVCVCVYMAPQLVKGLGMIFTPSLRLCEIKSRMLCHVEIHRL